MKYALCGAFGGLVKETIDDGGLILPRISDGKLMFGGFSTLLIGAVVGIVVDHSALSALMGGFMGWSVIEKVLPKITLKVVPVAIEEKKSDTEIQ